MDHTPGQMQWKDIETLRVLTMGRNPMSDLDFNNYRQNRLKIKAKYGAVHENYVVSAASGLGAVLASHDDTIKKHVETAAQYGVKIAEFPTTFEASQNCHLNNIVIMMGATNVVHGSSHVGNVSAIEMAKKIF